MQTAKASLSTIAKPKVFFAHSAIVMAIIVVLSFLYIAQPSVAQKTV